MIRQHRSLSYVPSLESWSNSHLVSAVRFSLIFPFSVSLCSSSLPLVSASRPQDNSDHGQKHVSGRFFAISGILPRSIIAQHVHSTIPTEYGPHVLAQKTPKSYLLVRKQSAVAL